MRLVPVALGVLVVWRPRGPGLSTLGLRLGWQRRQVRGWVLWGRVRLRLVV